MAVVQSSWQCDHVGPNAICFQCSAEIAMKRLDRMRAHVRFAHKVNAAEWRDPSVTVAKVLEAAMAEDARFDDCVRGDHSPLEVTTHGDPARRFTDCIYCGMRTADKPFEEVRR